MNIENRPESRILLIAVIMAGLLLTPVALADTAGSLNYDVSGVSAQPAWQTGSGPVPAQGTVTAYGSVSSQTSSSRIQYTQTVSASGKITSFAFSFHYEG